MSTLTASALEKLEEKAAWREHMAPAARKLQACLLADYQQTSQWPYVCSICVDPVAAFDVHLASDKHRKSAMRKLWDEEASRYTAPPHVVMQRFKFSDGSEICFNHLTGSMASLKRGGAGAAEASDERTDEFELPEAKKAKVQETADVLPYPRPSGRGDVTEVTGASAEIPAAAASTVPEFQVVFIDMVSLPDGYMREEATPIQVGTRWHMHWQRKVRRGRYSVVIGFQRLSLPAERDMPFLVRAGSAKLLLEAPARQPVFMVSAENVVVDDTFVLELETTRLRLYFAQASLAAEETASPAQGLQVWKPRPSGSLPAFSPDAAGGPATWNKVDTEAEVYWGRKGRRQFGGPCKARADICAMIYEFGMTRHDPRGQPLTVLLCPPVPTKDGWVRFAIRSSVQPDAGNWQRAWHGCKLEAVFSILYHGELLESTPEEEGERTKFGKAGIYLHSDKNSYKCGHYSRFMPLCGAFWAPVFECIVDRSRKLDTAKTDQWIQPAGSTKLVALWFQCRSYAEMQDGSAVSPRWDPVKEAHPGRRRGSVSLG
eukprot:TRINITY_DN45376_c0_g1_i3.p1 TRINITY_DN45376_c0_g1~~TRINITY_DN45376_c0_g1_i3.p1  ORF type:complete len:544 (-),score=105.98 TRINITY_DN45376_c0_g1_i3:58-1689(-)